MSRDPVAPRALRAGLRGVATGLLLLASGRGALAQEEVHFQRMTQTVDCDSWPSWSPRGDTIAFVTSVGGKGKLAFLDVGASGLVTVLDVPGDIGHPRWNPTGDNVIFSWFRDGKRVLCLYQIQNQRLITLRIEGEDPCWSPEGSRIAFVACNQLWFWRWGDPQVSKHEGFLQVPQSPSWMPDGQTLVLQLGPSLHLLAVASEECTPLSKGECTWVGHAAPSPDGERIAFVGCAKDQYDLYVLQRSTGKLTRLTDDAFWYDSPSWAPDGSGLVCQSDRMGQDEIWLAVLSPTGWSATAVQASKTRVIVPEMTGLPGVPPSFGGSEAAGSRSRASSLP